MSVRTIVEHGCPLTVQTLERVDALGATYWQARAMFRIASGQARVDVVTRGEWIERGQRVKVVEVQGNRVVVARLGDG